MGLSIREARVLKEVALVRGEVMTEEAFKKKNGMSSTEAEAKIKAGQPKK